MNQFTMVVCIVLIVAIAKVLNARRAHGSISAPVESADTLRLRDEIRQMKERIQVLERVITNNHKSVDLESEIERLRDR